MRVHGTWEVVGPFAMHLGKSMKALNKIEKILIEVQGFRFSALAAGPVDGHLVLLLHGFPEFADAWLDVMRRIAEAGFRAVAVDQRGYSSEARPQEVKDYAIEHLISDVLGFVGALGRRRSHLVGHDWGALLAWELAAKHPDLVLSLSALSTPHPDAFFSAIENDEDQKQRSRYIALFRMPDGVAENLFQADDYQRLRNVYQGKLSESAINENLRRLAEPGALTSALNWYRAWNREVRIGTISVPTLYIWGSQDLALGEKAAIDTAKYMSGPYHFKKLEGKSHWLLEEVPDQVSELVLEHIRANSFARIANAIG
jgi:pimeloyl-ACP methyl ester carboxylesterase